MKLSLIAAMSENNVIGKGNTIPWNLPDDMKYFKRITTTRSAELIAGYNHVIMGRKNWDSIPSKYRPLPQRINWVISRNPDKVRDEFFLPIANTIVVPSIDDALSGIQGEEEVFIIGGGEIYTLALPKTDRLYITEIKAHIDGDVFFPEINMDEWAETSRIPHFIDEKHQYEFDFVVYERLM